MDKEAKQKKLKEVTAKINKDHGAGILMTMADDPLDVESISTGSIGLDKALGIGGLPKGGIVEIYGPESSGKTTLALHVMAECQKKGGMCAIIDMEHALDKKYAKAIGVDVDELLVSQPDHGEQALQVAHDLIESGAIDVIVIDSVAALVPKGESEGQMGDAKMGLQARMMGQALRILSPLVGKHKVLCIFINQIREKLGVMFGNPETTSGGNALKFYAKVRLDVRRSTSEKNKVMDGEVMIGNKTIVKVIKNKVAPPFTKAEFDILFGIGIDKKGEIIEGAIELGIIEKTGAWFTYNGAKVQGMEKFKQLMDDNPELITELEAKLKN